MAASRIQIASNKKAALLKQNMREIAVMLAEDPPKEEKAKIRAEALIRDDNLIEAYEILQLECDLLFERLKLIEYSKTCPQDLVPVISTLIWASHRVDIPELLTIRKQFKAKYGKAFEEAALSNTGGILNERVVHKLSVEPPAAYLVQTYLERICEQYEVDWKPKVPLTAQEMVQPMAAPVGYSVAVAQGTGLGEVAGLPPAETGQANTDDEIGFAKQNGGIPPPVVTATATPFNPSNDSSSNNSNRGGGGGLASSGGGNQSTMSELTKDYEEVDIFIPPAAPASAPSNTDEKKDDDDDNDNNNAAAGDGGSSYSDLAARFDKLKK